MAGKIKIISLSTGSVLLVGLLAFVVWHQSVKLAGGNSFLSVTPLASTGFSLFENYSRNRIIFETAQMSNGQDSYWWLSSGGYLSIENGVSKTIQGDLPARAYWQKVYSVSNPVDTDGGIHPQNIFRLVTKDRWLNFSQLVYFKVNADNLSNSPNRNESNGFLFFSRLQNPDNLYYAGIRVDGMAVIKKKYQGRYYLLAIKPFFTEGVYHRNRNPNLIPKDTWLGMRLETRNLSDGRVNLKLCLDREIEGNWVCILDVIDDARKNPILRNTGGAGIRTDFMDIEFTGYRVDPE